MEKNSYWSIRSILGVGDPMGKNKKIYLGLVAYPLVCMALIHIVMTVFYIIPLNPITAKYNPLIKAYMDPLFTQTWQLFAPSPISHNYTLLMKVDYKPENQQESIRSEWIDISTSLIEASQKISSARIINLLEYQCLESIRAFIKMIFF